MTKKEAIKLILLLTKYSQWEEDDFLEHHLNYLIDHIHEEFKIDNDKDLLKI